MGLFQHVTRGLGRLHDGRPRMGKYRVTRRLTEGGMGEIFLGVAEDRSGFEKVVVLKRILTDKLDDRLAVQMFLDEARLMAAMNHPNVVQVYDFGVEKRAHFFAMEHIHGQDLGAILKAKTLTSRALSLEFALGVIAEAAAGLHYAHELRGQDGAPLHIVHRDISPSNVLVAYNGAVKLTDFGIAKWAKRQTETRQGGGLKGKIAYMSPEQCRSAELDRRSDVFGLGILLYELTTGTRLFQSASDFALLEQIVHHDAPAPSKKVRDYPALVEAIVMRALARDPSRRQPTARALQLEIEEYARERKLNLSPLARAVEMEELFGEKIGAWREAAQAGRTLSEHLAKERTITRPENGATESSTGVAERRGGRMGWWLAASGGLAAAVASLLLMHRQGERVEVPPVVAGKPPDETSATVAQMIRTSISSAPPASLPRSSLRASSPTPSMPPPRASSRRGRRIAADMTTTLPGAASVPPAAGSSNLPTIAAPPRSASPQPAEKKVWDPDSIYLP